MKSQWIVCNCCGADAYRGTSSAGGWQIGECTKCGLIYLNPAPFFEPGVEFSTISKGFQYTRYMHEKITPEIFEYEKRQFDGQQKEMRRMLGDDFRVERYLEVGCGSGASVRIAADLGWKATGLDIDPELVQEGIQQHGADLRCIPLLKAGLEPESFQFIRLRDVIEHLPNPLESLVEIHRLLCAGGLGLIVTPNEGGLVNRLRHMLLKRTTVAYVEPPHHIHGFNKATIERILGRAGFRILSIKTTTPVDPSYVTSNNMRSASYPFSVAVWEASRMLAMGNFLAVWFTKKES